MSQDNVLKQVSVAIEQGKARGYDEFIELEGVSCYRQFAIRLKPDGYLAYVFTVPEARMDAIEDYDTTEESLFDAFADAIEFLQAKGADLSRFKAFKANCPI
ncbi:hypothetical protein [Pseudomonas sp. NPDC089406]|uniref:hypothetical protein n=1 Tax=Pseudomonas sp. NPDC089406 TaxID=3364463 RepID=UPI00384F92C7